MGSALQNVGHSRASGLEEVLVRIGVPVLLARATAGSFEEIFEASALKKWDYALAKIGAFCEATHRIITWDLDGRSNFTPLDKYLGGGAFRKLHERTQAQRPDFGHVTYQLNELYILRNNYGPHLKLGPTQPEYADHAIAGAKIVLFNILSRLGASTDEALKQIFDTTRAGATSAADFLAQLQRPISLAAGQWFERFALALDEHFFALYNDKATSSVFISPTVTWTHVIKGDLIRRTALSDLPNLLTQQLERVQRLLVIRGTSGAGKTAALKWLAFTLSQQGYLVLEMVNPDPAFRLELFNAQRKQAFHCFVVMDDPLAQGSVTELFNWESFPASVTFIITSKPDDWTAAAVKIKGLDVQAIDLPITEDDVLAVKSHPAILARLNKQVPSVTQLLESVSSFRKLVFEVYTGRPYDSLFQAASLLSQRDQTLLFTAAAFSAINLAVPTLLFQRITRVEHIDDVIQRSEVLQKLIHKNEMLPFESWEVKEQDTEVLMPFFGKHGQDAARLFLNLSEHLDPGSKLERRLLLHVLGRLTKRKDSKTAERIVHSKGFRLLEQEIAVAAPAAELLTDWIPKLIELRRNELISQWTNIALQKPAETPNDCLAQVKYFSKRKEFRRARDAAAALLEANPDEPTVLAEYISLVRKAGYVPLVTQTITDTTKWLEAHPQDSIVRLSWAALLRQRGSLETIRHAIDRSLDSLGVAGDVEDAHYTVCLSLTGDFGTLLQKERAEAAAQQFTATSAPSHGFWYEYIQLLQGYEDKTLVDGVVGLLKNTQNWMIRLVLAPFRVAAGESQAVLLEVNEYLSTNPSDRGAKMLKARLLLGANSFEQAQDIFADLASSATNRYKSSYLRWLAEAEVRRGAYPDAIVHFSRAVNFAAPAARAFYLNARGLFFARAENYKAAEADFKSAQAEDPAFFWADFNLGALYLKTDRKSSGLHFDCALAKVTLKSKYASTERLLGLIGRVKDGTWPPELGIFESLRDPQYGVKA